MDGKKINRDFIKGGRGGGSPFYEVVSQKIFFFTNDAFSKVFSNVDFFSSPVLLGGEQALISG